MGPVDSCCLHLIVFIGVMTDIAGYRTVSATATVSFFSLSSVATSFTISLSCAGGKLSDVMVLAWVIHFHEGCINSKVFIMYGYPGKIALHILSAAGFGEELK